MAFRSPLTNLSQKLWSSKKTFRSYFVYFFGHLAFDPRWILWCLPRKEVSPWDCLLISKVSYRTVYPEKLFPWPPVCLLTSDWESCELLHLRGVLNFFLCFRSELATDEVSLVLRGTIRQDSKIRSQNVHFHGSFWREQTLAATKLFLSFTRIDFAVLVSSRAVRTSSRAVRVFPALSLRRVRPSYGTFSLMVFQGNCARGRTGHIIERLSLTLRGRTSNGKRQKWNFCRLSLARWTVEWKYLYLWRLIGDIFLFFCDLMKD